MVQSRIYARMWFYISRRACIRMPVPSVDRDIRYNRRVYTSKDGRATVDTLSERASLDFEKYPEVQALVLHMTRQEKQKEFTIKHISHLAIAAGFFRRQQFLCTRRRWDKNETIR